MSKKAEDGETIVKASVMCKRVNHNSIASSLRDLIRILACYAYRNADDSGDLSYYKEEGLDFDELWSDYWKGIYQQFFLSAFCDLPQKDRMRLYKLCNGAYSEFAVELGKPHSRARRLNQPLPPIEFFNGKKKLRVSVIRYYLKNIAHLLEH